MSEKLLFLFSRELNKTQTAEGTESPTNDPETETAKWGQG